MNLGRIPGRRLAGSLSVSIMPLATLVLCSCTAVEGPGSPLNTSTLVRVIDASYNSPALDAYVASTPIATNFAGPSISNYAFLPPGTATIEVTPTGKSTVLAQINGTLDGGQEHSVYITGQGTNFQMSLLSDQNAPAPSGSVAIRFLQQAISTGAVDIYFVPDGTKITTAKPVVTNVAPDTITAYLSIPAGTYDLVVVPAGTTTNAYTSAATAFSSGQVMTVLIVDSQLTTMPSVNVLVANDLG